MYNDFITLENAITYNNTIDKLVWIGDSLDLSPIGHKVLCVEALLMIVLFNNNIEIN